MDHVPSYGKALCAIAKGPPAPPFSVWEPARPPPSLKTRAVMLRLPDNRAIPAHFLSDAGRKGAPIALKTLADYYRFYNDLNQINGSHQTTNLGVRSSNLFGRANHFNKLKHILFGDPDDPNGLRTPCGPQRRSNSTREKRVAERHRLS